jgi:HlyD family secretion protein
MIMTKRIIVSLLILAAIAGASLFVMPARVASFLSRSGAEADTLVLSPRTISFWVEAAGTLRATSVQNFGAPPEFSNYWQFQIVSMIPEGRAVKKGEVLLNFDAQKTRDDLQRFQNELDQANKELEKTRVQIDLERQELSARLSTAENNYQKLKLKQKTTGLTEKLNEVEIDQLGLEQARREVEALKDRIEWHKRSSEATYQVIASKKARAENKVNQIKRGMENFQAKADRDGVVVYKTKWNGERFQVGETVWSGQPIMEIPDLNTILAEAFVPEVDIGKVKTEQRAEITIDAFPGKTYTGKVKNIGTLVRPKAWDILNKILEVRIALDELDTSIMRPAMSIKTRIETAAINDCLAVPLKAVRSTADGALVKVKTDAGWREQKVKLGESNGTDIVILEGLKAGDRIAADFSKAKVKEAL